MPDLGLGIRLCSLNPKVLHTANVLYLDKRTFVYKNLMAEKVNYGRAQLFTSNYSYKKRRKNL